MAKNYPNKLVRNRPSPRDEKANIEAYKQLNPSANRRDGKDISAVVTKDNVKGYAKLDQSLNRSRDHSFHRGEDFIPLSDINKQKKGK